MKKFEKKQKTVKTGKPRKDYDHNTPVKKCLVCYTLSGWHCYECNNDFCQAHFYDHKDKNYCTGKWFFNFEKKRFKGNRHDVVST